VTVPKTMKRWISVFVFMVMAQHKLIYVGASPMNSVSDSDEANEDERYLRDPNLITCVEGLGQDPVKNITDCEDALSLIPIGRLYLHPEPHLLGTYTEATESIPKSARSTRAHSSVPLLFTGNISHISIW
jgi:hypothetical protein